MTVFRSEPKVRLHSCLVAVVALAVYVAIQSQVASTGWFPADDAGEYSYVLGLSDPVRLLGADVFGLFRPVKNLLFFLFAQLVPCFQLIRLIAIAIGMASFFCVRAFFSRAFASPLAATGAAAIWLLAPTLVSSVAWLSSVNIQLMCALAALALAFHDRVTWGARTFAAGFLALALLAYEGAVSVGPFIFAFDFFLRPKRLRRGSSYIAYAGYALVTLAYLAVRQAVGAGSAVCGSFEDMPRLQISAAAAYFTCQHFLSWFWPFGRFAMFGGYRLGDASGWVLALDWCVLALLAALSLALRRARPVTALGLSLGLVGFLPVSNLLGLGNGPYGDYYLGLSSLGFSLVVTDCVAWGISRAGRQRGIGLALAAILVGIRLGAVGESFRVARLWAEPEAAFQASAQNFPKFFGSLQKLAEIRCNRGDYAGALRCCDQLDALLAESSFQRTGVYHVRALVALNVNRDADRALDYLELERRVGRKGKYEFAYHYLRGCVFEDLLGDERTAVEEYGRSLSARFDIDGIGAANRLARLMALNGELAKAVALWERALALAPDDDVARTNLERARKLLER